MPPLNKKALLKKKSSENDVKKSGRVSGRYDLPTSYKKAKYS